MSEPTKFIVSGRTTGEGSSMQITIPAAIAKQLPQGKSIRWELTVVEDGLHYRYLGQDAPINTVPVVDIPWVDGGAS